MNIDLYPLFVWEPVDEGPATTGGLVDTAECEITAMSATKLTVSGGSTDFEGDTGSGSGFVCVTVLGFTQSSFTPIALRKAKIVYNIGLSDECIRVNEVTAPCVTAWIIEVTIDLIRSGVTPSLLLPA